MGVNYIEIWQINDKQYEVIQDCPYCERGSCYKCGGSGEFKDYGECSQCDWGKCTSCEGQGNNREIRTGDIKKWYKYKEK